MSLLLLLGGVPGQLGVMASVLSLTAPTATLSGTGTVTLTADVAVLTLDAPTAVAKPVVPADAAILTLTAPTAAVVVSGVGTITANAALLSLSSGVAVLSIDLTLVSFSINGVTRGFRHDSLVITDELDEAANTCAFLVDGTAPEVDEEVIIAQGGLNNKLFAGHITSVQQTFEDSRLNALWLCGCVDYTQQLNRRQVLKHYDTQSATAVVLDIIATFTSGFTVNAVVAGLPTIDPIDFTMEDPARALTRIAKLIGGSWYVDYDKDIHFFITETTDTPDALTDSSDGFWDVDRGKNTGQRRTRVIIEGAGSQASKEVAIGATTVPLDDAISFAAAGGVFKSGAQRPTYAGKSTLDGLGSTVAGTALTPSAPSAAVVAGTAGNLVPGGRQYKTSFVLPAGESDAGSPSGTATVTDVTAPSAPSGSAASGQSGNLAAGIYKEKVTYETAAGETLASAVSGDITIADLSAPSAPSGSVVSGASGNLGVGNYKYKETGITAAGETLPSSESSTVGISTINPPNSPSGSPSNVIALLLAGVYKYKITGETAVGQTLPSTASGDVTISNVTDPSAPSGSGATVVGAAMELGSYIYSCSYFTARGETTSTGTSSTVTLSGAHNAANITLPTSSDSRVIGRRLYRSDKSQGGGSRRLVAEFRDNTTTAYTDIIPDVNRGSVQPSTNTSGIGKITVTAPVSGDARTVRRHIYRTSVDGSDFKRVATINDNSTTSFVDNLPDDSRGEDVSTVDTSGSGQITVTAPTHSDSRVTKRNIYRTELNGSTFFYLTTLNDNSDTSFLDNIPDSALGGQPPSTGTAGTGRISLTIPTSADARVTKRGIYRTAVGGSDYKRIATVSNNTATTFEDNVPDTSRGNPEPTVSDAGSGQINVTSVALGPSGTTARRIYRTEAGGTEFKFLRTITGNVTTSFTDNSSDDSLGEAAPLVSGIGALAGDTSLRVKDLAQHLAGGWVRVGDQILRFTGRSGSSGEGTLTGIPSSGVGAIGAGIAAGVSVVNHPHLTGVSGIVVLIKSGDDVNVLVTRNDTSAQTALAVVEGGDGIYEHPIQDRRLSIDSCEELGDAELSLFSLAESRLEFTSRDLKLRSGKSVSVNLSTPANIVGTFKIQRVVISGFGLPGIYPLRRVTASSYLFTIDHLFRRMNLGAS